jgi:dipeptidyl aminopeptidase/acylaminoacyl peptidase
MSRFSVFAALCVLSVVGAPAVLAQKAAPATATSPQDTRPPPIPTRSFASRSMFSSLHLSPDGKAIVTHVTASRGKFLAVLDAADHSLQRRYALNDDDDVEWIRWAGNDKLLVSLSTLGSFFGDEVRYTRLLLLDMAAGTSDILGNDEPVVEGDDVIFIAEDGSYALVSVQKDVRAYPSVYRYELAAGGKRWRVQDPRPGVWSWHADSSGVVRLGTGWRLGRLRIYYRSGPDADLRLIEKLKADEIEDKFWDVAQIVSGSDHGHVLHEGPSGRVGLYIFDLSTREPVELVYEHPEHDVESVLFRDGKPVGAFFTDVRDRAHWLDAGYAETYAQLERSLTQNEIWVISRAKDNSRMLVRAGSEADPGLIYNYDVTGKRMEVLVEMRPEIDITHLAMPKPIAYTARDGTRIHGYLTLPRGREASGLPLIILPHGGPYGIRDKLDYDDQVQLLANRGYAVLQPNFRGSGGYGQDFYDLGVGQIGRGMQDDLDDGMDWAVARGIADPARVCVVGGSYGGYAALWAVIRNPERYRCAASFAGVTDWNLILKYDRRFFTREASRRWRQRVEGEEEFDLDDVSPYRHAETLNRPVLIAQGKKDDRVPWSQFRKFTRAARKAPVAPVELVFNEEGHSFDEPENEQRWLDQLTAFLAKHNPAD